MRSLLSLFALALCAEAQSEMRNTLTLSGGWAHNVGRYCCGDSAASVAMTYAYRLFSHVAAEVGVDTALSLGSEARGAYYDYKADDRFFWVPFGLRGVLPAQHDRVEVSASGGAVYERYSVGAPAAPIFVSRDGWGGYVSAGAAIALDRGRHFWVGSSPRLYFANTNRGYTHDRWVILNVGLGFRF